MVAPNTRSRRKPRGSIAHGLYGALPLVFVTVLTLAMLSSVALPRWRAPSRRSSILASMNGRASGAHLADETADACCAESAQEAADGLGPVQWIFFSFLWSVGIAQQYQLFNWIDERNYSVRYEAAEYEGDKQTRTLDADTIFLPSMRGILLQCYLHGITWMQVPRRRQTELRRSLFTRQARKVCQRLHPVATCRLCDARRIGQSTIRAPSAGAPDEIQLPGWRSTDASYESRPIGSRRCSSFAPFRGA